MPGMEGIISRSSRRLAIGAFLALAGLWIAVPPSAGATTITVHTNRGGTCRLQTIASRASTQINYGIKVKHCPTRFGVRYAVSRGSLYDKSGGVPVSTGYLGSKKHHLPYQNQRGVSGTNAGDSYRTRIDISIVLKTRHDPSTRHAERWTQSGKHCRVKTTKRAGDTLGCEIGDSLPA
jgi:hypothetical protein